LRSALRRRRQSLAAWAREHGYAEQSVYIVRRRYIEQRPVGEPRGAGTLDILRDLSITAGRALHPAIADELPAADDLPRAANQ